MSEFVEIFMPSARHLREEKERLLLVIEQAEDGAPPFGIDIDAGVATIDPHATDVKVRRTPAESG